MAFYGPPLALELKRSPLLRHRPPEETARFLEETRRGESGDSPSQVLRRVLQGVLDGYPDLPEAEAAALEQRGGVRYTADGQEITPAILRGTIQAAQERPDLSPLPEREGEA